MAGDHLGATQFHSFSTYPQALRFLAVVYNWAVKQGFIPVCPSVAMPKGTDAMKGRPITEEEFDRMIEKADCIGAKDPEEWRFLLRGLWWSGLRLGEALKLHWTDENHMCVDLDNELIIMQAHSHKAKRYTESPMAPEFADMLRNVPAENREGFVFNPLGFRDMGTRLRTDTASKLIVKIGKKAQIKVAETDEGKVKYASAHDFRRAFGFRWSRRVSSTLLKELMRHKNIATTEKFYVGQNAKDTVKRLRESLGTSLGTSDPKTEKGTHDELPQVPN
ncbi:MAG: hypothetical protein CMN21_23635 [Rubinisphaera sp.]|nr:hypothetical protein [Rubinisphaera sp.]